MMHRTKKKNDPNEGKWIGIGGKLEEGESPEECLLREVKEESGLTLTSYKLRGIITFSSDKWESEYMFLFSADGFEGELSMECDEGELMWVPEEDVLSLRMWEGDRKFIPLIMKDDTGFFSMKLSYVGEDMAEYSVTYHCS